MHILDSLGLLVMESEILPSSYLELIQTKIIKFFIRIQETDKNHKLFHQNGLMTSF